MSKKLMFPELINTLKKALNLIGEQVEEKSTQQQYADCLVWNQEGKFLILLRSRQDDFEPGKWCLPGGKIDQGEESDDAAIRELEEETNLKTKRVVLNTVVESKDAKIFMYDCFDYDAKTLCLVPEEHINYAWITTDEIDEYDFLLDLRETLNQIFFKTHEIAYRIIGKAFDNGQISEESYLNALSKYKEIQKAEDIEEAKKEEKEFELFKQGLSKGEIYVYDGKKIKYLEHKDNSHLFTEIDENGGDIKQMEIKDVDLKNFINGQIIEKADHKNHKYLTKDEKGYHYAANPSHGYKADDSWKDDNSRKFEKEEKKGGAGKNEKKNDEPNSKDFKAETLRYRAEAEKFGIISAEAAEAGDKEKAEKAMQRAKIAEKNEQGARQMWADALKQENEQFENSKKKAQ